MKSHQLLLRAFLEGLMNAPRDLYHLLLTIVYLNRPGRVHFEVADGRFDGHIKVRPNLASCNFARIGFRVDNPFCIRRGRISGRTLQRIQTQALLSGFNPVRIYISNQPVQMYKELPAPTNELT